MTVGNGSTGAYVAVLADLFRAEQMPATATAGADGGAVGIAPCEVKCQISSTKARVQEIPNLKHQISNKWGQRGKGENSKGEKQSRSSFSALNLVFLPCLHFEIWRFEISRARV